MNSLFEKSEVLQSIVIFKVDDEEFGIKLGEISSIISLDTAESDAVTYKTSPKFYLNINNSKIPVFDFSKYYSKSKNKNNPLSKILLIDYNTGNFGIKVDEVKEIKMIDHKEKIEFIPLNDTSPFSGILSHNKNSIYLLRYFRSIQTDGK